MSGVKIRFNEVDAAISVMREVAAWGGYLNAGYKIVDIIDHPNGRSMALYEMEV